MAESSLLSLKSNERDFRDVLLDGGDEIGFGVGVGTENKNYNRVK